MKIEAGSKAIIYCLSGKPEGTIISIGEKNVVVEIERGTMTVDKEDIIEGDGGVLKVLNYVSINEKETNDGGKKMPKEVANFVDNMMDTVEDAMKDKDEKGLYHVFMTFTRKSMEESGKIFPFPCMFEMEGKKIAMAGLALPMPQLYSAASGLVLKEKPIELIFGSVVDNMKTKGGIDPKYKNVLCVFRMKRGKWMYGVLGFNGKADIQNREPDWNNQFWTERMRAQLGAGGAIEIKEKIGTAYSGKITITKWRESHKGYFYEGDVNIDKLDEKTQKFIKDNNLNMKLGDKEVRGSIMKFFEDQNMKLEFMDTGEGFFNLVVSNKGFVFTDKRSKSRAILEAIETIANSVYETNENDNSKS